MQPLSATLNQMKSPEDLPKEPSRGLTPSGGGLAISPRNSPLTEGELTSIASKLLLRQPIGTLQSRKKYGRKLVEGIWFDDMPIGDEQVFEISFPLREKLPLELLQSALRQSPPSATIQHLTHLAAHKRLGSGTADRSMLFVDYTSALRGFSDFVIYIVCKCVWEGSPEAFFPKISVMNDLCCSIQASLTRRLNEVAGTLPPPKPKAVYFKEEDTEAGQKRRREMCDYLVSVGRPDPFDEKMTSNYHIEGLAKCFGWGKDQQNPPAPNPASETNFS